jgi:hypothetical protein
MSYDDLSSVSQNVLKFISSLPVKRGGSLSFLVGTISNVWTDVGSGGYILVSCAHSNTSYFSAKHAALRSKSKDWLAWNLGNVS